MGGSTSIRNIDADNLEWKKAGYFQRNRDLGQVFTPEEDLNLKAIVLWTGPSDKAVLSGAPDAKVFVQFFEVVGDPEIMIMRNLREQKQNMDLQIIIGTDDFLKELPIKVILKSIQADFQISLPLLKMMPL